MDYEKAYKHALERAKKLYEQGTITESLSNVFHELRESEDDRIRKAIIEMIHDTPNIECEENYNVSKEETLAWLEKQGEQKPKWTEEDKVGLGDALWAIEQAKTIAKDENDMGNLWYAERWLKSIKQRIEEQQ